jgi:MFS family permease
VGRRAYALTFVGAMFACGMIGDEVGRKRVMLAGAGVFCADSALCALTPATGLPSPAGGHGARRSG